VGGDPGTTNSHLAALNRRSCRVAAVGCDDAAKLASALDWAITGGPEIDLKNVVSNVPSACFGENER